MAKIPEIIPVTDLRQDAAAVLKRIRSRKQPLDCHSEGQGCGGSAQRGGLRAV